MIIAVDGPAAAGKGTLARELAKYFNLAYLDTGKLYRAVGYSMVKQGQNPENIQQAEQAARNLSVDRIEEIIADPALRSDEAGQAASKVAAIPAVRAALLDFQRNYAINPPKTGQVPVNGAVLDGRDIGTVVCPEATAKLFVTASVEIRAQRRFAELQELGKSVIKEHVLAEMKERDARDSSRSVAPLVAAQDAYVLDTSNLTRQAVLDTAVEYVQGKLA